MTNRSQNNFTIHQPLWSLNEREEAGVVVVGQHIHIHTELKNDIIAKIKRKQKITIKFYYNRVCYFDMACGCHSLETKYK